MSVRRCLVACVALSMLASRPAAAQSESSSVAGASPSSPGLVVAEPNGANAPLLRSVVSLDLRNVRLRDALRAVSAHMGGRLMYDESVTSLKHRVTLRDEEISLGRALRQILAGTDVEVFVSQGAQGGQLVLLKRVAPPPPLDSATVRGVVTDSASGQPIGRVMVYLDGTRRRSMTNDAGVFVFTRVPVGEHEIMVRRLGYAPWRRTITVAVGAEAQLQVQLSPAATMLDDVVTTGSGDRQRIEVGNSIPVIDAAAEVEDNAYRDLSELLAGRSLGLNTTPGSGSVNSQTRHRIRGINSISASNDPIIIIDGIRSVSGYPECRELNLNGCTNVPSRLDDLDVDNIESIEILKGPAASALWGSDASNGVIVIKTKRGQAGPTRWTFHYDEGFSYAPTNFAVPLQGLGTPANGSSVARCSLTDQALGKCVPIDSMAGGFNRYDHPRTTSMATGRLSDLSGSLAGGDESMQFYFSGGYKTEVGTAKMPDIDQKIIRQALGRELPGWMVRPDTKETGNVAARLTGQLNEKLDYAISTNFIQLRSRAGGDGVMGATNDLRSVADTFEISTGWNEFYVERKNRATRFIGSLTANWRPVSWFSGHAVVGRDYAFTDGGDVMRRNWCLPFCSTSSQDASGKVAYGESRDLVQTVNLGGTFNVPLRGGITLRTAVGAQHTRTRKHDFEGTGRELPVGRTDLNSVEPDTKNVFVSSDDQAMFGMYLDQSVALNDRLFLGAAVRRDVSSTLGSDVAPVYPKWSLSWLASEEPFLAGLRARGVSSLRLRGAFGHAGVQPSSLARLRSYSQLPRFVEPGGAFGSNYAELRRIGNDELRPERSIEREGGFELGMWNDRLMIEYTAFHKFTRDAILSRKLAPSIGMVVTSEQDYNVGNVKNTGIEARISARIIDRPAFQWSMDVAYASRENELVSLGAGVEPFSITASNVNLATTKDNDGVVMPGYPLFGRWARPIAGFSDANGDGILTPNEVKLGDSLVFIGPSQPKADVSIRPDVGLWNGRLRVSAGFEYVHGITQMNTFAEALRMNSAAAYDPTTPLRAQACIVASLSPHSDSYCFYETVNVLRLRDLSIGLTVPDRFAHLLRAQSATFYLLGSNLGVWSQYEGIDPMANTADAAGNRVLGGAAVPRGKTWTLRARLTY